MSRASYSLTSRGLLGRSLVYFIASLARKLTSLEAIPTSERRAGSSSSSIRFFIPSMNLSVLCASVPSLIFGKILGAISAY